MSRPLPAAALLLSLLCAAPVPAATVGDLYRGEAVVTGQDNLPERRRGFREALAQVLVKVSGDASLAGRPGAAAILDKAGDLVAGFTYEDRKKGIQISDEQGTRDRSYVLSVDFVRAGIDRAVAALGGRSWGAERPRILVLLGVRDGAGDYVVGRRSERGHGQREVLLLLEKRRALPLALPLMDAAERDALTYATIASGALEGSAEEWRRRYGADALLSGRMDVTPAGYWDTRWTLSQGGEAQSWTVEGTTFDRAIGAGLGEAARLLSGL